MPKSKPDHVGTKVKDLMEVPPVIVSQEVTIEAAAGIMWDKNIGSVIIVDGAGKMVGILTERDVLYSVTKSLVGRGLPISSIMSKTSLRASPNESIATAVDRMIKSQVRHLPVVDKDERPVGMISQRDAMGIGEPLLRFVLRQSAKKRSKG